MKEIMIGKTRMETHTVTEAELANHVGSGEVAVFATPMMIAHMEHCAAALLKEFLEDGETSVGVMIHTTHDAPTPCGKTISVSAQIKEVNRKKVTFSITAKDDVHTIGIAVHERVIVERCKFETNAMK